VTLGQTVRRFLLVGLLTAALAMYLFESVRVEHTANEGSSSTAQLRVHIEYGRAQHVATEP
jgi:hypothetical protein